MWFQVHVFFSGTLKNAKLIYCILNTHFRTFFFGEATKFFLLNVQISQKRAFWTATNGNAISATVSVSHSFPQYFVPKLDLAGCQRGGRTAVLSGLSKMLNIRLADGGPWAPDSCLRRSSGTQRPWSASLLARLQRTLSDIGERRLVWVGDMTHAQSW